MHVEQFLRNRGVWFEVIKHRPTFTAQTTARALHVAAGEVAKSILLHADGRDVLAVVPGGSNVDLSVVKRLLKTDDVSLVHESELLARFPDCVGVMPSLAHSRLRWLPVALERELTNQ